MDDGRHTPCCRFTSHEDVEIDPELYVCETCTVAAAFEALDEENRAAWELFHRVCGRFVIETRSVGTVLARLTASMADDEYEATLQRVALIYEIYYPPKRKLD
jgi:hypothetical protein